MLIPPAHHRKSQALAKPEADVYHQASHLCFAASIVKAVFGEENNAYMAHYPEKHYLLFSPVSSPFFKKMHPATQHLLKTKNLQGSKSIALHELLIDHDLALPEGPLQYEILDKAKMLKVYLIR
ncbi:MAG: hypothetical protein AAFQ87_18405 [Bacteroidota bacterium]